MVQLDDLTIAQVSGMIAAGIFVLQFLLPLALPLVMLGLTRLGGKDMSGTAVSWSVATRFFHSSLWPTILQSHSSRTFSTPISVMLVSLLRPAMIALVGIAAVVTPLGLYETIEPVRNLTQQPFHYVQDTSPFGLGTPPRTNATWSRKCGGLTHGPVACPHSGNNVTRISNSSGESVSVDHYSSKVPAHVVEAFQSGLSAFSDSVSSSFDIQYRSIIARKEKETDMRPGVDDGSTFYVGAYRQLSTILLSDEIGVYEGLIVDMKQGGLGFRNHTAPPWTRYGSEWSEDILFIEPESVCVDTNLTIDFEFPEQGLFFDSEDINRVLTDRGGFVNINRTFPTWDKEDPQGHPDLWLRAYRAAWLNNADSMLFMNITSSGSRTAPPFRYFKSSLGQEFSLHGKNGKSVSMFPIKASSLQIAYKYAGYLMGTDGGIGSLQLPQDEPLYTNPFNVSFDDADIICQGAGGADFANISNAAAACGLLYGVPRPRGGSSSLLFDAGSSWSIPMFSCISTVKASIKTVSFRFNGTDSLAGLFVTGVAPKIYSSDEDKPLWGVEKTTEALSNMQALWGLVTPEAAEKFNLSTLKSERLYLPGLVWPGGLSVTGTQNLPAVDFAGDALGEVYNVGPLNDAQIDYSGASNLDMYRLWQELTRDAATAHKILNLIWTDVAANMVLGTKSWSTAEQGTRKRDNLGNNGAKMPMVTTYGRKIRYHYAYGIPAFLALALALMILASSVLLAVLGPAKLGFLRIVLEQTSAGRLLALGSHEGGDGQIFTLDSEGWKRGDVSGNEGGAKGGSEVKYHRVNGGDEVGESRHD